DPECHPSGPSPMAARLTRKTVAVVSEGSSARELDRAPSIAQSPRRLGGPAQPARRSLRPERSGARRGPPRDSHVDGRGEDQAGKGGAEIGKAFQPERLEPPGNP